MIIKTIRYIFIGLLLGVVATLMIMQQDPWVKEQCGAVLQQAFARSGNCKLQGTTKAVSLLYPCVDFVDVTANPLEGNSWHWHAKQMRVSCSWWHLILYGSLELHIEFEDITGSSDIVGQQIAIFDHIAAFVKASPIEIPTSLQALSFKKALFTVTNKESNSCYAVAWDSRSRRIENIFKSQIYIADGAATAASKPYLEELKGTAQFDVYTGNKELQCVVDIALSSKVHGVACHLKGSWQKDHGTFAVHTPDRALSLSPITCKQESDGLSIHLQGTVPLAYALTALTGSSTSKITGCCTVSADIHSTHPATTLVGSCAVDQIAYDGIPLGVSCSASSVSSQDATWHGEISCKHGSNTCQGTWSYQQKGSASIAMSNKDILRLPTDSHWCVQKNNCNVQFARNAQGILTGSYECKAIHEQQHETITLQGTVKEQGSLFTIQGALQDIQYKLIARAQPDLRLQEMVCKNSKGSTLLQLHALAKDAKRVEGSITFDCVNTVLRKLYGIDLQGEGLFDIRMLLGDTLTTKIQLQNGTIRLPHTYNFVQDLSAVVDFDSKERSLAVSGLSCLLHKGEVMCDKGLITFDSACNLSFVHMPLLVSRCLLNFNKDLFANVSGRVVMYKQHQQIPQIKGHIVLEQGQLKENILSHVFQKDVGSFASSMLIGSNADMGCDLHVATKEPIQVKTPFLETRAKVGLHIHNTLRFPEINGSIDLLSGSLYFPYKPLFITRGRISFMANQLKDPLIELSAKNKIKKFNVGLYVTGSLTNHHIALQSSPSLTEEQILALLLTGSQEESLNIIMPALIMNNITDLIFGRDQGSLKIDRYFKKFLSPLSRVHVIPSFSDQTARGGLRAAVELDINERWRAMLQKNFSLSEDTRLEVECQLSDDISIRGIRDERRDIGGEVEMRWKF